MDIKSFRMLNICMLYSRARKPPLCFQKTDKMVKFVVVKNMLSLVFKQKTTSRQTLPLSKKGIFVSKHRNC